jgi:excinuclease ABC subunit B
MQEAAVQMEYEKAAYLRDEISKLEQVLKRTGGGEGITVTEKS